MSTNEIESSSSQENLHRLNERQAWHLLELDTLYLRLKRKEHFPLGEKRLATAAACYRAIASTGMFGEQPFYFKSCRDVFLSAGLESEPPPISESDATFAESAAFLDLVSEWVACDDIYTFLDAPDPSTRPVMGLLRRLERMVTPRDRPSMSKMILNGVDTAQSLRGFFKYVDLSVDLRNLTRDELFPAARRWAKDCMGHWFQRRYSDRVIHLLESVLPNDGLGRQSAVISLRDWLDSPLLAQQERIPDVLPLSSQREQL
jgi:hypothetical protein